MVTIAAPNVTIEKTPVKRSVVCPDGAVIDKTVDKNRHRNNGPHKSQSRRASSELDFGLTTINNLLLISNKSRSRVSQTVSLRRSDSASGCRRGWLSLTNSPIELFLRHIVTTQYLHILLLLLAATKLSLLFLESLGQRI